MKTGAEAGVPIRVGIRSCLPGEGVRFDGGHKRDRCPTDTLGPFFAWAPVCPKVEMGLGTPRETLRLVGVPGVLAQACLDPHPKELPLRNHV